MMIFDGVGQVGQLGVGLVGERGVMVGSQMGRGSGARRDR